MEWLWLSLSGGVPRRSAYVALVVGTILNVINQGDALLAGAALDPTKLVLTYMVPYLVATYGAVAERLCRARDALAPCAPSPVSSPGSIEKQSRAWAARSAPSTAAEDSPRANRKPR